MPKALIAIALLAWIPLCWQPVRGQSPSEGKSKPSSSGNAATGRNNESRDDQIGSQARPPVVDTQGHQKSQLEAADDRAEKEHVLETERRTLWAIEWTAYATLGLVLVGLCGTIAAVWTLRQIKRQADTMEQQVTDAKTSSDQQSRDVRASINEAVRSATAMEGVATSFASSVESARQTVGISREIADTQKIAMELGSRAYLSVFFNAAKYQDANSIFEVRALLQNHGNTPAYDVAFKATAQIIPMPVPEEFAFPLPDETAGTSVSLLAPGTTKFITKVVAGRVPDDEAEGIKRGLPPRCLAMWGIVNYRDAFGKLRYTKFAFTVYWQGFVPGMERDEHGNLRPEQVYSLDTARHNEAD